MWNCGELTRDDGGGRAAHVGTQEIFTDEWWSAHNVLVHHELDAGRWKEML